MCKTIVGICCYYKRPKKWCQLTFKKADFIAWEPTLVAQTYPMGLAPTMGGILGI